MAPLKKNYYNSKNYEQYNIVKRKHTKIFFALRGLRFGGGVVYLEGNNTCHGCNESSKSANVYTKQQHVTVAGKAA